MSIEFDPVKALSNLRKHRGSLSHVEQALRDPEDPDSRFEQRQITLGMDSLGRLIIVVHTQRDERTRLISARKASPGEAARYYA